MFTQCKLLPRVEPQLGRKFPALLRYRWQGCQLVWGKVCGQNSVLPDADEQHAQSCASLSSPFIFGHIPGWKCKYINNIKTYLHQHPDVSLAAVFVLSRNLIVLQPGRAPCMLCLGKVSFLLLEWNPLFPPSAKVVFALEMKAAFPSPRSLTAWVMFQVTEPQGCTGRAGRLP